jgi:hypothetical protein
MRDNNKIFKFYENPSFVNIHIQKRETLVKIAYNDGNGLRFYIEFIFNGKSFKKALDRISTKEKTFNSDEIEFEGIELHPIDKDKIAQCLNEILDFYFSN